MSGLNSFFKFFGFTEDDEDNEKVLTELISDLKKTFNS